MLKARSCQRLMPSSVQWHTCLGRSVDHSPLSPNRSKSKRGSARVSLSLLVDSKQRCSTRAPLGLPHAEYCCSLRRRRPARQRVNILGESLSVTPVACPSTTVLTAA